MSRPLNPTVLHIYNTTDMTDKRALHVYTMISVVLVLQHLLLYSCTTVNAVAVVQCTTAFSVVLQSYSTRILLSTCTTVNAAVQCTTVFLVVLQRKLLYSVLQHSLLAQML